MKGIGLPELEILKVTEEKAVEFRPWVVMLLVEATRVITTPLPTVTTLATHHLIRAKSLVVVKTTGMRRGRRSMINY